MLIAKRDRRNYTKKILRRENMGPEAKWIGGH